MLLKDQEIITALDCSSNGAGKSDNPTWDGVIRCVGSYVYAEIDFGTCVKSTNFSVRKHQVFVLKRSIFAKLIFLRVKVFLKQ